MKVAPSTVAFNVYVIRHSHEFVMDIQTSHLSVENHVNTMSYEVLHEMYVIIGIRRFENSTG